jgi:hypothetical protein
MSEQSEAAVHESVRRGCGFVALCVGSVVNALAFMPIAAIKGGGYLSLIVALALVLQAGRVSPTESTTAPAGSAARARSEPMGDAIRRKALLHYSYFFALAAAGCLLIGLAGDLNVALYAQR